MSCHAECCSLLADKVQNMHELARLCSQSPVLHRLRSITLTINQQTPLQTWMADVQQFLAFSPLEVFQIYSTGAFFESPMTYGFWREIINTHGTRLTRFSVHRMLVGLESIQDICRRCLNLEQLFVVIEQGTLVIPRPPSLDHSRTTSTGFPSIMSVDGCETKSSAHQLSSRGPY